MQGKGKEKVARNTVEAMLIMKEGGGCISKPLIVLAEKDLNFLCAYTWR